MARLGDLVDIRVGASIRGKLPVDPEGNVLVVQQGDITPDGLSSDLQLISYEKYERYQLRDGDIILRSKGSPILAAEFRRPSSSAMPVIAAASVLVLRINSKEEGLYPLYLAWLLNSAWGQAKLQTVTTGTQISVLPAGYLRDLEVPVPGVQRQRLIGELSLLAERQEQLARDYREKLNALLISRALEESGAEKSE